MDRHRATARRLDPLLTELDRAQAALQPQVTGLPVLPMGSLLGRAVQTARILFGDADGTFDSRLSEIDPDDHACRFLVDLRREMPESFAGLPHDWYDRTPWGV